MNEQWLSNATEDDLKKQLVDRMSPNFHIYSEIKGCFLVDKSRVVIDYLFYPKLQLKEQGFVSEWFGIEVKALGSLENRVKKGIGAAWQSITYSQSKFTVQGESIRPAFVLMYPPFSAFFSGRENDAGSGRYVSSLLQRANVGALNCGDSGWSIHFGSQILFSSTKGLGNVKNLGMNRYVGNVSTRR